MILRNTDLLTFHPGVILYVVFACILNRPNYHISFDGISELFIFGFNTSGEGGRLVSSKFFNDQNTLLIELLHVVSVFHGGPFLKAYYGVVLPMESKN